MESTKAEVVSASAEPSEAGCGMEAEGSIVAPIESTTTTESAARAVSASLLLTAHPAKQARVRKSAGQDRMKRKEVNALRVCLESWIQAAKPSNFTVEYVLTEYTSLS